MNWLKLVIKFIGVEVGVGCDGSLWIPWPPYFGWLRGSGKQVPPYKLRRHSQASRYSTEISEMWRACEDNLNRSLGRRGVEEHPSDVLGKYYRPRGWGWIVIALRSAVER